MCYATKARMRSTLTPAHQKQSEMQCALAVSKHVSLTTLRPVLDANVNVTRPQIQDTIWHQLLTPQCCSCTNMSLSKAPETAGTVWTRSTDYPFASASYKHKPQHWAIELPKSSIKKWPNYTCGSLCRTCEPVGVENRHTWDECRSVCVSQPRAVQQAIVCRRSLLQTSMCGGSFRAVSSANCKRIQIHVS